MSSPSPSPSPSPVPVFGILNKHSPFIGYFFYSAISKNIASFFPGDVTTLEEVELRRRVRFHPYTGCFHFAPGQYSDLHGLEPYRQDERLQKDLQKRELSPEAQSLYETSCVSSLLVDPDIVSCSSGDSHSTPSSPNFPTRQSRLSNRINRSDSKERNTISRSSSKESNGFHRFSRNNSKEQNSPFQSKRANHFDGELRSFSPDIFSSSGGEESNNVEESRALTLLEFKKRLVVEKKNKNNKKFLTRRESDPIPSSPKGNSNVVRRKKKKHRETTFLTQHPEHNNSFSGNMNMLSSSEKSLVEPPSSRPIYNYGTHEHNINKNSLLEPESPRPRSATFDWNVPINPVSTPDTKAITQSETTTPSAVTGPDGRRRDDASINLSCSMGSWQVHNHRGTKGFINNNIKSKIYDHSVKTYDQVTKSQSGYRYRDGESAMSRLRELTLNGEEVHVSSSTSSNRKSFSSCQPRLVDDYTLHLNSMLGEGAYARVFLATCLKTSRPVAVKVVDKEKLNPTQEACVRRELTNQARLWHHNVVPLQAIYESQKNIYIVLEYCAAGTLEDMLKMRRKLTEEESRYVAYQLITALHYVHSSGILHGDITPANVMFQPASLLSSSGGINGGSGGEGIPRVDLLYEKKRREGSISITLLQAPVVNFQKRSRDGDSEKSGGYVPVVDADALKLAAGRDLVNDITEAEMREYLVRTDDIQLVNNDENDSLPSLRRDISSGAAGGTEKNKSFGGGNDFTSAAIRNSQRGKVGKKKRSGSLVGGAKEPSLSTTLEDSDTIPPTLVAREKSSSSTSSCSSGAKDDNGIKTNDSTANIAASWWEHQYIRYKCPYGMLLRVGDFGLCQKIPDVRHFQYTGDVKKAPYTPGGTEGYLPPEVIQKLPYGQSADLWAVGTVLYRCICGAHPFVPNESCLHKELNFKGYAWKKVSTPCVEFIQALLTKDESQRPSAKALLGHQWFAEYTLISEPLQLE